MTTKCDGDLARCETCTDITCWLNSENIYFKKAYASASNREHQGEIATMRSFVKDKGCASHSAFTNAEHLKELFRKEIAKWKEEDPLFMAYVHGQEAGRKEGAQQIVDVIKELEWRKTLWVGAKDYCEGIKEAISLLRQVKK